MLEQIVELLFECFTLMIFGTILASWIPELQGNRIIQFLQFCTAPYLNLFRRIIPPLGMIDISPIVAIFALAILKNILIGLVT